jgi:hypothetical protein
MVDGMASAPAYSFVHTGHLAEPLLVADAAGAVVSSITRDPWGNAILLAQRPQKNAENMGAACSK